MDSQAPQAREQAKLDLGGLRAYMVEVMENFTYRYLQTGTSGTVRVLPVGNDSFMGQSVETSIKDALQCRDEQAREGIIAEIRRRRGLGNASVAYFLQCQILEHRPQGSGRLWVQSSINWDYPEHALSSSLQRVKKESLEYEDTARLRFLFPLALEKVCEIF